MEPMNRAAEIIWNAKRIVCFSGAGISAASGIHTYQDTLTGLWADLDPRALDSASAFRENPKLVWGWYLWRRQNASSAQPNAAHLAFPKLGSSGRIVSVITQNVDERAGSNCVLHLHGSLCTPKCFACHRPGTLPEQQMAVPVDGALVEPPRCGRCNGKLRPGVVWYGEDLPSDVWKSAIALAKSCDVLISVGTSGIVTPAADIPRLALLSGATVIHVNTEHVSTGAENELMLVGKATEVLTDLCAMLSNKVKPL